MKKEAFVARPSYSGSAEAQLFLEGQLVIRNASLLKQELLTALSNSQNLELILKNITKVDMAFIQLIIALQKTAAKDNKSVSVKMEPSGFVSSVVRKNGLEKYFAIKNDA